MYMMPTQRRRTVLTVFEKYQISKFKQENSDASQVFIAKHFSANWGKRISRRTIGDILSNKDKWTRDVTLKHSVKKFKGGKHKKLDDLLALWIVQTREKGNCVITDQMVKKQAEVFSSNLGIVDFKFSNIWLQKFKIRRGFIWRQRQNETATFENASSSKSFPSTSASTATRSQQPPKILPHPKKIAPAPSTSRAPAPTPVHLRIAPKPQPPPSPAPPVLVPLPSPIQVSQDVCLRWNSYHTNMQNSFPMLLDTEQFVDVTLACEGQFIKCHKMVLSACSTFFNELLNQNPCQHPIIVLRGSKMWEIRALIDFMYRGEVNVAQDKLASLLQAAEEFQVKGLAGSSTRAPDNSPLHHIPNSPPDPTYHPGDPIDDHKPSSSRKILKRKAPQSYEPNVIHHQSSRKVPLQPIPKLKIKTREILNSTETDTPMKNESSNQPLQKKTRQMDSDEADGPASKKSSGTKENVTEVQIKEECLDYVDFDVASNSGSYAGTNYQQNEENGENFDENYDNDNNSIDPLNVDKLQCDGYDNPYD